MAVRLIDREALKEVLNMEATLGYIQTLADVFRVIDKQPTLTTPNEWVSAKDRLPEAGALIVYANNYGNEALYGVLRVPKNERPNRYDYWMYLPELPYRRPPEEEEDT